MTNIKPWLNAIRLRTLPLAFSCIFTGSALAWNYDRFSWLIFFLCLSTAFLLQILSNLANDFGDFSKGTDNENRIGPVRALQSGLITKRQMTTAIVITTLFQKVITARSMDQDLPKNFDVIEKIFHLTRAYPSAFISLISIPDYGTWIGASPELLVSISRDNIFKTVALAATRILPETEDISEAVWNQKEIEEQAMVSRYIIEQFKKIRHREFIETGPATTRIGSTVHLKTEYTVDLNKTETSDLPSTMLELLHPTSAVCGMPKAPALDFIEKHEELDRGLFSGYLGPVNIDNETNIFVNLRCMQLFERHAVLYAGAGITRNSNPEREFTETEWKLQTMLDLLK